MPCAAASQVVSVDRWLFRSLKNEGLEGRPASPITLTVIGFPACTVRKF